VRRAFVRMVTQIIHPVLRRTIPWNDLRIGAICADAAQPRQPLTRPKLPAFMNTPSTADLEIPVVAGLDVRFEAMQLERFERMTRDRLKPCGPMIILVRLIAPAISSVSVRRAAPGDRRESCWSHGQRTLTGIGRPMPSSCACRVCGSLLRSRRSRTATRGEHRLQRLATDVLSRTSTDASPDSGGSGKKTSASSAISRSRSVAATRTISVSGSAERLIALQASSLPRTLKPIPRSVELSVTSAAPARAHAPSHSRHRLGGRSCPSPSPGQCSWRPIRQRKSMLTSRAVVRSAPCPFEFSLKLRKELRPLASMPGGWPTRSSGTQRTARGSSQGACRSAARRVRETERNVGIGVPGEPVRGAQ